MPRPLTPRQREYFNFIRQYIRQHGSSPRLEEIAAHFGVKNPTAHKMLQALQSKGRLYFGRDSVTGFFIRVPERIGATARLTEIGVVGKVNRYGEVRDFPHKEGHFPIVLGNANPENLFALEVWQHIPSASIQAGDYLIFDAQRTTQPHGIGLIRFGEAWLLARLYPPGLDEEAPFYGLMEGNQEEWETLIPQLAGYLFWWPLAYSDETDGYFTAVTVEKQISWQPVRQDMILATLMRLERPLSM